MWSLLSVYLNFSHVVFNLIYILSNLYSGYYPENLISDNLLNQNEIKENENGCFYHYIIRNISTLLKKKVLKTPKQFWEPTRQQGIYRAGHNPVQYTSISVTVAQHGRVARTLVLQTVRALHTSFDTFIYLVNSSKVPTSCQSIYQ